MTDPGGTTRIDKWLWAARFFKTRSLAQAAVSGGKVHVNGERVKPSRQVEIGDTLEITRGQERLVVCVEAVSEKRGPASVAQGLYAETQESRRQREETSTMRKLLRQSAPKPATRPDKRSRRRIIRFKEGE